MLLLVFAGPVILVAQALVRIVDGPPTIFRQKRMGFGGVPFTMLKIRTMAIDTPPPSELGPVGFHHPYVTRLGAFLRRSRIDELPQVVNVLRGDMLLVGPRPRLVDERWFVHKQTGFLLTLKPGLTGLAEISGNVLLTEQEQLAIDFYYARNRSILLNTKVLALTLDVILRGPRRNERLISVAVSEFNKEADSQ